MKLLLIILPFVFLLSGCDKENNVNYSDIPVIESYLIPGCSFTVKITRQISFSDDPELSDDDIDNLDVKVEYPDGEFYLSPEGDGLYTDSTMEIEEGITYTISFQYNNKTVTAYTYIPSKPADFTQSVTSITMARMDSTSVPSGLGDMPDPIEIAWNNPDGTYYIVVVKNIETDLDPIRDFGDEDPPDNMFREKPNCSAGMEIRPMEFQYYGTHQIILYHVLPDYATLYDESTTTSLNLTNPSTSISNGYGIFTGLNSDTLYIEVNEAK